LLWLPSRGQRLRKKPLALQPSLKKNKQSTVGVRNSSSLPTLLKRVKMKSLSVSRFAPEVKTTDIEKSLLNQLKLLSLTGTRLKTKFQTYASFHVSVTEDDFLSVNNTGVCPNG
jgi:hypothetical protein